MSKKTRSKSDDYEVGYGKPPEKHRFRPGQSGNAKGRPAGAKNKPRPLTENALLAKVIENANRSVKGTEGGREITLQRVEVVIESLFQGAVKERKVSAQKAYLQLFSEAESRRVAEKHSVLEIALEYKRHWKEVLAHRNEHGIVAPDPVPHPEDISIDLQTGEVWLSGPATQEQKEAHDQFFEIFEDVHVRLHEIEKQLKGTTEPEERERLQDMQKDLGKQAGHLQELLPLYASRHGIRKLRG